MSKYRLTIDKTFSTPAELATYLNQRVVPALRMGVTGHAKDAPGATFLTDGSTDWRIDDIEPPPSWTIDMDAVVDLLRRDHGVPNAYVEHTGGGCATLFVGETRIDDDGTERQLAMAGPGWFAGPELTVPRGESSEFWIGPDDDGQTSPQGVAVTDSTADVAKKIADITKEHRS